MTHEVYITKCDDLKSFESGAKRDNSSGKGAYELISPIALERLAKVYERGAKQKGDRNWENGFPMSRCLQSAIRHTFQYLGGMRDEDHLAQASWNLFAAMHFEECIDRGILSKEFNDMPDYTSKDIPDDTAKENKSDFRKKMLHWLYNKK